MFRVAPQLPNVSMFQMTTRSFNGLYRARVKQMSRPLKARSYCDRYPALSLPRSIPWQSIVCPSCKATKPQNLQDYYPIRSVFQCVYLHNCMIILLPNRGPLIGLIDE